MAPGLSPVSPLEGERQELGCPRADAQHLQRRGHQLSISIGTSTIAVVVLVACLVSASIAGAPALKNSGAADFVLGTTMTESRVGGALGGSDLGQAGHARASLLPERDSTYPTVVATIPLGSNPVGVAYDSGKSEVFVSNQSQFSNYVSVINDTSNIVVATVPIGAPPEGLAYDPAKSEVFAVAAGPVGHVCVINDTSNSVVATVQVGSWPFGVVYDSGKGEVFVTDSESGNVSVINDTTNTVVATIPVNVDPLGMAYDPMKGEVFVTNSGNDTGFSNESVINDTTNTVVATVPSVGFEAKSAAYDAGMGDVFVTNFDWWGNNVWAVSDKTNTVVATVKAGWSATGVTYDSWKDEVIVANIANGTTGSGNVSFIWDATDQVVATVPVGSDPGGIAYDAGKGEVFVANFGSNNVSVISVPPPTYSVKFQEIGLPSGTPWWVNVSGVRSFTGTGKTIAFNETNGSYTYTIASVDKSYAASGGSFVVAGTPVSKLVRFKPVLYSLRFEEVGLPKMITWGVVLTLPNGRLVTLTQNSSVSEVLTTKEPNGTYGYSWLTVAGFHIRKGSTTGTLTVKGANPPAVVSDWSMTKYIVEFKETGLAKGTKWNVTIDGITRSGKGTTLAFTLPNGTFSFTIVATGYTYTSSPSSPLTIDGAAVTVTVTFTQ